MSTAENRLDLFHKTASVSVNTRRGSYMWSYYKQKHATHARVIFLGGGWFTWNIVSDVYILMKGKKSINAEKNENVELTHFRLQIGYKMQTENLKSFFVWCVITCHLPTHRASRNKRDVTVEYITCATFEKQLTAFHVVRIIILLSGMCLFVDKIADRDQNCSFDLIYFRR